MKNIILILASLFIFTSVNAQKNYELHGGFSIFNGDILTEAFLNNGFNIGASEFKQSKIENLYINYGADIFIHTVDIYDWPVGNNSKEVFPLFSLHLGGTYLIPLDMIMNTDSRINVHAAVLASPLYVPSQEVAFDLFETDDFFHIGFGTKLGVTLDINDKIYVGINNYNLGKINVVDVYKIKLGTTAFVVGFNL